MNFRFDQVESLFTFTIFQSETSKQETDAKKTGEIHSFVLSLMRKFYTGENVSNLYEFLMPFETSEEEPALDIDLSCFWGNLRHDDNENARNCWRISDGNNFKVRGKSFCEDKRKVSSNL